MRKFIILILSLTMAPAASLAASGWVKGAVTFERPVRSDKAIVGGESVWRCKDATCTGRAPDHLKSAERYCRELARWGGPIASFQTGAIIFDADALGRCNEGR